MKTAVRCRSGVATDTGPLRTANEDRLYADDNCGLYVVVDGLGGHAAGDVAAQTALDAIVRELLEPDPDVEGQVRRAIVGANNDIFDAACKDPSCAGMACVLTLAVVRDDVIAVGHVGDTRLYLVWNGTLRKMTSDHSPVGELEDAGELTETDAMVHPRRNEVFRDVGTQRRSALDEGFIEFKSFPFHPSAAILLASDGLTDALTSAEIAEIIEAYAGDPGEVAELLVEAANARGGLDNVSVVFVAGPDYLGVHSPAMTEARGRHAITRMRNGRRRWKRIAGRVVWLVIGILLGMLLLAALQQFSGHVLFAIPAAATGAEEHS